ncbi:kinase-like protein [Lizonia empirigonia]|nr:kinase-like protein [Lizonia empirigonia]
MANVDIVGIGGSAIVSRFDATSVLKGYIVIQDGQVKATFPNVDFSKRCLAIEYRVYRRLGNHDNILQCYGLVDVQPGDCSLRLEFVSKGSLRGFIETNRMGQSPITDRLKWCIDLATGLAYMHSLEVFHCDFSCRNVLLTEQNVVKICDFGGASLDGNESEGVEEPRYELPLRGRAWEMRPYVKRDLFALGSCIYEIMAWKKPFPTLDDHEIQKRFDQDEFPDLSDVLCRQVIQKCWNEGYDGTGEVLLDLQAIVTHTN